MATVLIAEDDVMIADLIEDILVGAGYTVCGIASTVAEAVKLGNAHRPDLAILDLRLRNGDFGPDIVPLLTKGDRIGILYASASDISDLGLAHGDVSIRKPYGTRELLEALQMVQAIVAGAMISQPVPAGVHVLT